MTDFLKIAYYRVLNSYIVYSKKMNESLNSIVFKFDTGATHTVVSLAALLPEKSKVCDSRFKISEFINNSKSKEIFKSAAGVTIEGMLCVSHNVEIGTQIFDDFYFYLTSNTDYEKALLGDDFISCCDFEHRANSDIIITKFSKSMYEAKHQFKHPVFEIDSLDFDDFYTKEMNIFDR